MKKCKKVGCKNMAWGRNEYCIGCRLAAGKKWRIRRFSKKEVIDK